MTAPSDRPHDIVVFGATSFVGEILCRYLVERHGTTGELAWAIAGRSADKLAAVAESTGADVPRIVATWRRSSIPLASSSPRSAPMRSTAPSWWARPQPRAPTTATSPASPSGCNA
jgi:hypothetical protein